MQRADSLQHSLSAVQPWLSVDTHAGAHLPPSHLPLQHCAFFLHFLLTGLHSSSAAATPPMPSDDSVPPTRAAPINLSALPRVRVPLANPPASSSKVRLVVSPLTAAPFPQRAGLGD